jgi:hypothetical protein
METGLSEQKVILGWFLDLRRMTIALTENKFIAYSNAIQEMFNHGWTTHGELESNIGQWVHIGQIIPFIHHFLSQLCFLMQQAKKKRQININKVCREDLQFLLHITKTCAAGVDLNSVTCRQPTHAYKLDSCPAGLRGFSHQGFAWRFYLPPEIKFRVSNNLLKHLAAIITPWVDIIAGRLSNSECALLMTNNTTLEGWLKKINFIKEREDPIQATICIKVACLHATLYLSHGIQEYSQWFCGAKNMVTDALSRDNNRSDKELINILRTHCPSQLPQHFKIVLLPSKITSWLTLLLLWLPVKQQLVEKHTRMKLGCGTVTPNGANNVDLVTTYSSTDSPDSTKSRSWAPWPWLSVKDGFLDKAMTPWLKNQSLIPSTLWLQPSENTAVRTRRKMSTTTLQDFYADN